MNRSKILSTGVLALVTAGASLLLGAGSASAATTPPWEPDVNSEGNIVLYDATGNVITSGSSLDHLFDYAAATSAATRPTTKAQVSFAFPDHNNPTLETWFTSPATGATNYPNTTAPAPVNAITFPVAKASSAEANLTAALGGAVLDTTAGYANVVQLRLYDSGAGLGNGKQTTPYWQSDISYNTATGAWTQIYPASVQSTTTALTVTPNPSTVGNTVTLKATVAPAAAAGTVQFKNGAANVGGPVAVASGVAQTTTNTLPQGSDPLSAVFTPTDPSSFGPSTGTATATVNPVATHTSTTLAVSGGFTTAGSDTTLTATVSPASAPGTVAFYDNGSTTALPGTVTSAGGVYTLDVPTGFAAGSHSVVAKFAPTNVADFEASQSAPQTFLTQPPTTGSCAQTGSVCTDEQNIQATVPVGTLVIDTPYTSASPLDLGTLALSPDLSTFSGSASFEGIKVTDLRAGDLPWTVSAIASPLTDGGSNPNSSINAQNVGLTAITATPGSGFTGIVTPTDNAAANGVAPGASGSAGLGGTTPHTVAAADHGRGTVTMKGTLTLNAPASTEAGLFTGTVTFTVG